MEMLISQQNFNFPIIDKKNWNFIVDYSVMYVDPHQPIQNKNSVTMPHIDYISDLSLTNEKSVECYDLPDSMFFFIFDQLT